MSDDNNRPEWLPDKFKSPEDLAKAYSELEKNYMAPPENYDLSRSKYLSADHDAVKDLAQFAKGKRVPADVMDKFLGTVDAYFSEFEKDPDVEMAKLGDNAKERIDKLNNWTKANLPEAEYKALMSNLSTGESVLALEKLRDKVMSGNNSVPNGNSGSSASMTPTMADLQKELNNNLEKYKTDPAYQKDWTARMTQAKKGFVDKAW